MQIKNLKGRIKKSVKKNRFISLKTQYFLFLMAIFAFSSIFINIPGANAAGVKTNVLYLGDSQGITYKSIGLDKETINLTHQGSSNLDLSVLDNYDVCVINDLKLNSSNIQTISNWAQTTGHGVIVIMGPNLSSGTTLLKELGITNDTIFKNNTHSLNPGDELSDVKGLSVRNRDIDQKSNPLLSIEWNTAPEMFYFSLIPNLQSDVIPLIKMQWAGNLSADDNYPLICAKQLGSNNIPNVYVFSGWFQEEFERTDANEHMMVWPFFNYMMFTTIQISVGNEVPVYGSWKYSPVPHLTDQIGLGIFVFACGVISVILYKRVRKNSNNNKNNRGTSKDASLNENLFKDSEKQAEDSATTADQSDVIDKNDVWERIGFHRQISGFLKLFFVMILLLIPQLLITSIVMPRFLNPYPQAAGWYSYTLRFFEAIWLMFDLGFKYSITKFFAQYRIENPRKAYHYVQLFVWWEIFSGVAQIFIVAFLGSLFLPLSNFSYLSWMFVIHSLIQFPGIFLVFQYFFQGNQRADYQMISFALQYFVLRMALQLITVPIFRLIYANNIMYGPAFGAAVGLLVGQLLGDIVLFAITWKLYKGLKLPIGPIFYAEFSKKEFWESFKFGGKMTMGEVWVPLVWLLQVYLVGIYLPNSSAEQGYFELAFTISTIPQAISLLMNSMLGGLTEAHQYNKKNLLNYISFSGVKWGSLWTYYLCAAFFAIGREFIIGASGPNWARAAALMPLLLVFQLLGPISWQGDFEFAAANKPLYAGIAWIIEQSIRASLIFILLSTMRVMEAVIIAYIISLAIKDVIVLFIIRTKIHKWDWHPWQAFITPGLSAIFTYIILRGFVYIIVDLTFGIGIISAMLLFVISLFFMEYVFSFFMGLLGGYDDNTLEELNLATQMITGVKGLARFYYTCAKAGAKISPLHNKFKVDVFEEAMKEAEELTSIKKKIVF